MSRIRPRLTYANVTATIALFGVLAGGGAYAASKIGPNDIRKNAVRSKHVKKNAIKSKHVKNGQVRRADLARPTPWRAIPLRAGWIVSASRPPRCYRDLQGLVHLSGRAFRTSSAGSVVGNVPCGAPIAREGEFPASGRGDGQGLRVLSNRTLIPTGVSPGEDVSLDGIAYPTH